MVLCCTPNLLQPCTAPVLSQFTITLCPCHTGPHTAPARTIGRSSIQVMLSTSSFGVSLRSPQGSCNHLVSVGHMAPHLNDPDASVHMIDEGDLGWGIILIPFQSAMHEGAPPQDVGAYLGTQANMVVGASSPR